MTDQPLGIASTRMNWRRKLLTIGGLGAVLGLARTPDVAHAAHDVAELGIGLDNPHDGAMALPPTALTTTLRGATGLAEVMLLHKAPDSGGFTLKIAGSAAATGTTVGSGLISFGGSAAADSSFGGSGARFEGGHLTAGSASSTRFGGLGIEVVGGNGGTLGNGSHGIDARGGTSTSFLPGAGLVVNGGTKTAISGDGGPGILAYGGINESTISTGVGIYAESGVNYGVHATTETTAKAAVFGENVDAGPGVHGDSGGSAGSQGVGVLGTTSSTTSAAVHGVNSSAGAGVRGESGGTAGSQGNGVEGTTNSTANAGVRGANSGSGYGVYGQSSTGVGMRGVSFGAASAGVEGVASGSGPGVWGFTSSGHAVLGNSTSGNGGVFSSSTGYALSASTTTGAVGLFVKGNTFSIQAQGNLTCTGSGDFDGGIVVASRMADGSRRATSAVTSPDAVVEDFGRARLVNGTANVELDRQFASLINTADYAVFLTPRGDSKGLYVTNVSGTGFTVREQQGGTSTLDFDYRIVAKRTGTAARARFAKVDEPPPAPRFPEMPELPKPESTTRTEGSPSLDRSSTQPTRSTGGSSIVTPSAGPPLPRR
jgi:hypothetical protein